MLCLLGARALMVSFPAAAGELEDSLGTARPLKPWPHPEACGFWASRGPGGELPRRVGCQAQSCSQRSCDPGLGGGLSTNQAALIGTSSGSSNSGRGGRKGRGLMSGQQLYSHWGSCLHPAPPEVRGHAAERNSGVWQQPRAHPPQPIR